jgi:hypothetical protein
MSFTHHYFKNQESYSAIHLHPPRMAKKGEFGIFQRLKARLNPTAIGHHLFLGYCTHHKQYYLDYQHTNGNIRCPRCDRAWLIDHGYLEKQVLIKQRYWIRRKDGVKQRYWKVTRRYPHKIPYEITVQARH